MAIKNNRKRLVAAAIAVAGLTGGAVAADAATFSQRVTSAAPPVSFANIAPTCTSTATPCVITLDAGTGTVTVADAVIGSPQTVPIYGFNVNGKNAGEHTLAGGATSTIKVPQGATLNITLTQSGVGDPLQPIDLSFPSLPFGANGVIHNPDGTYTVHATKVGTSVFQPGTNVDAPRQIAMGLVGVLIVTPTGCADLVNLACAYDTTPYADEALVATTDLDYQFAKQDPAFPGMGYFGQSGNPDGSPRQVYHVINGKSFPDTDVIDVKAGDKVLLRSVNAGVTDKSMSLLGLRQSLLARNASQYTDPQMFISPLVGPGETADLAVQIPTTAAANQRYALIDAGRQMNNGTKYGFGGALTFFNVWPATQQVAGPPTVTASYDIATQTLSGTATPSDPAYPVTLVEYSTNNTTWSTLASNPLGITTFGTLGDVTMSAPGTIYVRVTDSNNYQGTATVLVNPAPPTVTGATAAAAAGTISASATAGSGLTVVAAEYFVVTDPGVGLATAMTVGGTGPYTVTATATLNPGDIVSIRAKDNFGQWGPIATATAAP